MGDLHKSCVNVQNKVMNKKILKRSFKHILGISLIALLGSWVALSPYNQHSIAHLTSLRSLSNNAYQPGELLKYRIHYGAINAGIVSMSVSPTAQNISGKNSYAVKVEGETVKSFEWAYKVRDKFESWIDQGSQAPLRYAKTLRENDYFAQDIAIYDHENAKLRNKKGEIPIPKYTQDIASAIYYLRNLDYNKAAINAQFPVDVYIDNEIYKLPITYKGKEIIKTDIGKIRCIKLKPQLVVDRVFAKSDAMTVWVSDDENRIPIRIQTDIRVGSLKVDITSFQGLKNTFSALVK